MTIFLQDFTDYGNGGATALPNNIILVGVAPFHHAYEVIPGNERMNWLMNHELVHMIMMDKSACSDRFYRWLFRGKVMPSLENPVSIFYSFLTTPRTYSPRWYHEGIAVFLETWTSGGLGRAMGSYDEMVFRTKILENARIYDVVGLEAEGTAIDFQVGAMSYMYGTRFFSYCANRFGPEKVIDWANRSEGSKAYFADAFMNTFHVLLEEEWRNWIEWEKKWQKANLDAIRKNPVTPFRLITTNAVLGSVSRTFYDPHKECLYSAVRYPGQIAHIASIDIQTGKMQKICDIKGAALYYVCSLAYDSDSKTLFYTTDNNHWRDLNAVDVRTGKSRTLIKDVRTGNLVYDRTDQSLWGTRHQNGIVTIVKISPPYRDWMAVHAFPYGTDVYDIDISPDGLTLIAAMAFTNGTQKLIIFETKRLLADDGFYEVLFDFDVSSPANFVFTSDGKMLVGSSYYTGVSNIYRYDLEKTDMNILSNCKTGLFNPVPVTKDSLIVFRYTGAGFTPGWIPNYPVQKVSAIRFLGQEIVENHPIVKSWIVGSPTSVPLDSLKTYSGKYNSIKAIRLSSAYPIIEGYKDQAAIGYRLNFENELQFHGFNINISVNPNTGLPENERLHLGFQYHYWNWKFRATYNGAGFYDLFGPTKISRKGYSTGLEYTKRLIYDDPRTFDFTLVLTGYSNLETMPEYQNIQTSFDKFVVGKVGLKYEFVSKSLGAVDEEKGLKWHLMTRTNVVRGQWTPQIYTAFAYGVLLPIHHSSLWYHGALGYSAGESSVPFSNFYFGGFGNNYVDHLPEKRYREYTSFPGMDINSIGGTRFGKTMMEWTLPPVRFRRFGFPALYFNWIRTAVFSSFLFTDNGDIKSGRSLWNTGIQTDLRIVLFSHFKTTFSLGYAVAAEKTQRPHKEWMVSLKIM